MEALETVVDVVENQPATNPHDRQTPPSRFRTFSIARAVFIVCQLLILGVSLVYFASPDGASRVWESLGEMDPFYLLKGAILLTTFVAPAIAIYIGMSYIPGRTFRYFAMAVFTIMAGYLYAGKPDPALGMVSSLFKNIAVHSGYVALF